MCIFIFYCCFDVWGILEFVFFIVKEWGLIFFVVFLFEYEVVVCKFGIDFLELLIFIKFWVSFWKFEVVCVVNNGFFFEGMCWGSVILYFSVFMVCCFCGWSLGLRILGKDLYFVKLLKEKNFFFLVSLCFFFW